MHSGGAGMSQSCITLHSGGAGVSQSGITLHSGSAGVSQSGITLHSGGAGVSQSGITLHSGGAGMSQSGITLHSGGAGVSQSGITLHSGGAGVSQSGITLHSGGAGVSQDERGLRSGGEIFPWSLSILMILVRFFVFFWKCKVLSFGREEKKLKFQDFCAILRKWFISFLPTSHGLHSREPYWWDWGAKRALKVWRSDQPRQLDLVSRPSQWGCYFTDCRYSIPQGWNRKSWQSCWFS